MRATTSKNKNLPWPLFSKAGELKIPPLTKGDEGGFSNVFRHFVRSSKAVILALLFSTPVFAQSPFSDVPPDHWARKAIQELVDAGILSGFPDGTFQGNRPITRYELAVVVQRIFRSLILEYEQSPQSRYVTTEEWQRFLLWLTESGPFSGDEPNLEFAALSVRMGKVEGEVYDIKKKAKLSFSGDFRIRHMRYSESTGAQTIGNWTQLRARVNLTTAMTEKSTIFLSFKQANNMTNPGALNLSGSAGGTLNLFLEQGYATFDLSPKWTVLAGRRYFALGPVALLHESASSSWADEGLAVLGKLSDKFSLEASWSFFDGFESANGADAGVTDQTPGGEDDFVFLRGEYRLRPRTRIGLNVMLKGAGEENDAAPDADGKDENKGWSADAEAGPFWAEWAQIDTGSDNHPGGFATGETKTKKAFILGADFLRTKRFTLSAAYADIEPEFGLGETTGPGDSEDPSDPIFNTGVKGFQVSGKWKLGKNWSLSGTYLKTDPACFQTDYGFYDAETVPNFAGCDNALNAEHDAFTNGRETLWKIGVSHELSPAALWRVEYLNPGSPTGAGVTPGAKDDRAFQTTLEVKF